MPHKNHSDNTATHTPKPTVKLWQHPWMRTAGAITLAAGLAGLLIWAVFFRPYLSTDDARIAATTVRIGPSGAGGVVMKINAAEGDRIKAGSVLIELDHRTAQAQLQRAQARLQLAKKEAQRMEQMAAENGISPRDLDSARANLAMAEADIKLAEIALSNTYLSTPVDGIVIQKSTEVGNILEPGQTGMTVTDIERAWVTANIEENSVGRVKAGQPVTIHVDEGGTLTGRVADVRAATAAQFALIPSDNPSGNFTKLVQRIPIKIALDAHPGRQLRVGQSVEIKIHLTK